MDKVSIIMFKSLTANISLSIIKIIFGILGFSGALIADGIHSFSDALTDLFATLGNKISQKPADYEHPYGHGNAEYITCLAIGIIIFIMGINVIVDAVTKESTIPSTYVAVISLITLIIKIILSNYLLKKGKQYESNILISSGKESSADCISSLIVFISVIVSSFSKKYEFLKYSDKIAMIIVGALVLSISIDVLKENLSNLLGKRIIDDNYIELITKIIKNEKDIRQIDSLIIIKYGPLKKIDCEVSMDGNMELNRVHDIIEKLERKIKKKDDSITNLIIHVNPYKS